MGDFLILIAACLAITRRWRPLRAPVFTTFLGLASGVFVWLNIEPWVFGAPVTVIGPPPTSPPEQMRTFSATLTYGFPLVAADFDSIGLRPMPVIGNVALGCVSWSILFAVSRILARHAPTAYRWLRLAPFAAHREADVQRDYLSLFYRTSFQQTLDSSTE